MTAIPQTVVNDAPPLGLPGLLYDSNSRQQSCSAVNSEATAVMAFGIMVAENGTRAALLLAAVTDRLKGIVIRESSLARDIEYDETLLGVKPKVEISLLEKGRIWVPIENTVTEASEVHVRCVATGSEVAGAFRNNKDGTDTLDLSAFARWVLGGTAATGAVLEFDLTNRNLAVADT